MIRLGLVATTPALRLGLQAMLGEPAASPAVGDDIEIVYTAASLPAPPAVLPPMDLLVVAGEFDPFTIKQYLIELSTADNRPAVLLLTDDSRLVRKLAGLSLPAWGALSPEASAEELAAAVRAVNQGLLAVDPRLIAPALLRGLPEEEHGADTGGESLTERENQVLQLLARGLSNKQVAANLFISDHTVKFHISSIFTKLGVTNRTEAVRVGIQRGLVVL